MPLEEKELELLTTIRSEPVCRGCGEHKTNGCIVCWDCFKRRADGKSFKYFEFPREVWDSEKSMLNHWLKAIGKTESIVS